jgi:hypothetical protein
MAGTVMQTCRKHGYTQFYYRGNRKKSHGNYCKSCHLANYHRLQTERKARAIEYKGGKCIHCGYKKCPAALDFHHVDPTKKLFGIAQGIVKYCWQKIQDELDKCDLVCSNCHREIAYEQKLEHK